MRDILVYLFWPNPGNADYSSPKAAVLLGVCVGLLVFSYVLSLWRRKTKNPVTKKLSRSWSATSAWMGVTGLVLVVARVEEISYLSIRFLWVLWGLVALLYLWFQIKQYRMRHYEKLPTVKVDDPREQYLPKKK